MSQHRNNQSQRGQIIVIAVALMFLLAFIAGLFLTLISRNIGRTARGGDVLQAQYLAEAGIRYADQQLTHSIDGADWRPEPLPDYMSGTNAVLRNDPDYDFLHNGYTRFNQGNGRFLLRVSFQPVELNADGEPVDAGGQVTKDVSRMQYPPMGRYIKIESIGRRGVVDPDDPTTFRGADPLRRMLVAYKPIGITDYARYITNKDRVDSTMVLGSFPFRVAPAYEDEGGAEQDLFRSQFIGPIRVNGDLMWTGLNTITLNAMEPIGGSVAEQNSFALPTLPGVNRDDTVAVAGRVFHDAWPFSGAAPADAVHLTNKAPGVAVVDDNLQPSVTAAGVDNLNFSTAGGVYRDSSPGQSGAGKVRGVSRLEPPLIDEVDSSTGILRYRLLTRTTGIIPKDKNYNTGVNGLGLGIYIDNNNEIQTDNQYRRLTDEWAQTGTGRETENIPGSAWRQHMYTPPGAEIYLDPTPSSALNTSFPAGRSQGTIIITRHDGKQWKDENGSAEGYTRRYRYPLRRVYDNSGTVVDTETYDTDPKDSFRDATGAYKTFQNGVIFVEGNLRLQGKLPADWVGPTSGRVVGQHLTFVTMGTAYIEGNLLKGDAAPNDVNKFGKGLQLGSITIVAKNYVCVNTTAYFLKQPNVGSWNYALGNPYTELGTPGERYETSGFSAVNPSTYTADNNGVRQNLFLLQTAEGFPGAAAVIYMHGYPLGQTNYDAKVLPGGDPELVSPSQSAEAAAEGIWQHRVFPLVAGSTNYTSWDAQKRAFADWFTFIYRPTYGENPYGSNSTAAQFIGNYNQPLWISRVAVSPMDVRIEAVMYAQEGSFFVIPGEWLNSNPVDLRNANLDDSLRYANPSAAGWRLQDLKNQGGHSAYPFHYEPADIRVVINGAITENTPADKDYQTAWSRHWGWTPKSRPDGSTSDHAGEGLVFMYDQSLRLPLRYDQYNRPLPPCPALPVSPDLVFFGEAAG
ncbi:MAG TPA: hypothetical protein VGM37_14850 [Armatimonadota bacterium]|jgi:hypothetical protein